MHTHIFFELVYVMHGSAIHCLGSESTQLRAGDYFIIDPGTAHCYQNPRDFEIVNCLFLPEYIDRALTDCPTLSALLSNQVMRFGVPVDIRAADRIFHDSDGTVKRLIQRMEQEFSANNTGSMELLRCYLTEALVSAVRATEKAEHTRKLHKATAAMVEYLTTYYAQPLSLEAISRKLNYSPQYLSTLFRKDTGMAAQTFLQQVRIQNACHLLSESKLSIYEIGQNVGYSDSKHFSKIFHRHKGISPRAFRYANR